MQPNPLRIFAAWAIGLVMAAHGAGAAAAAPLPVVKPVASCASLASLDLSDVGGAGSRVTSATETTATINGAPVRFCTVEGTLAPAIGFRVRLPVEGWTQRYLHMGCGGLCGNISAAVEPGQSYGCPLVQQGGFVLSSTDMGHSGNSSEWTKNAQQREDFAWRGVHVTTVASKKLIQAFYGQATNRSYFSGCSDGGREGLMAAQRYPEDYQGIIVGAPAFHFQIQNSLHHAWLARANRDNGLSTGKVVLLPAKAELLHTAVVKACDALDGQTDGLLADPRLCSFDPGTLQCPAGASDSSACLTSAEVDTARKFYNGPRDAKTNLPLLAGGPQYGSELSWSGVFVPASGGNANGLFSDIIVGGARHLIFEDATPPTMDQFEFSAAFYDRLRPRHAFNDATNPDLSAFQAAGGKLILWHGWADQHISPRFTIAYHEAMQKTMGQSSMDRFMRMYLVPGVAHCGGGEGHPNMDLLSAMVDWVESQQAPGAITTFRTDKANVVTSSRPVYPYPALARYKGSGDANAASSYGPGPALYTGRTPDWAGADWFQPYRPATR
jgi:hypothetical protein